MSVVLYETMIALDGSRVSAEGEQMRQQVHTAIEKYGAEIIVARPWDENGKLAYPIRKQKKAYFYIVYYKMDPLKQHELESDFRINENVLRQMTLKVEEKWADAILEIAKNETATRFALRGMKDEGPPTGEGVISNDPMVMAARGGDFGDGPPRDGPPRDGPRGPRRGRDDKPE